MLIAIGLQESRFQHRRQVGGPARGFWQFEQGGGCVGVLNHTSSRALGRGLCTDRGISQTAAALYGQLERDDLLACAMARLLLWTDPQPLPTVEKDAADSAWAYYLRVWRPGRPHRHTWDRFWAVAVAAA